MDRLSHVICDSVEVGIWKPLYVSKSGPSVSHLMFADDLLLFGVASVSQAECMLKYLNDFMAASSGKINMSKSSMFFSPRVPLGTKRRIATVTQLLISTDIGKYLGFPLSCSRRRKQDFQYIIDRVRSAIAAWKSK
ncbi:hypothetical protein QN277_013028 [Acacia crassicarpa]|uniref:Reverse transcriptase n=1 Tax=Acacia crassicarpa TaxID=499986 RepID=A0AAE1N1I7_9FABA|nr:hypothetical protein QN277_013028 [Acacia crassicarpa]